MAQPRVRTRATYEDLKRVPDHLVAEILEGELFASPRPPVARTLEVFRLEGRHWVDLTTAPLAVAELLSAGR